MRAAPLTCATTPAAVHHGHSPVKKTPASVFLRLRSESEARVGYLQVVEKGSECFESLRDSEEFFNSLFTFVVSDRTLKNRLERKGKGSRLELCS